MGQFFGDQNLSSHVHVSAFVRPFDVVAKNDGRVLQAQKYYSSYTRCLIIVCNFQMISLGWVSLFKAKIFKVLLLSCLPLKGLFMLQRKTRDVFCKYYTIQGVWIGNVFRSFGRKKVWE